MTMFCYSCHSCSHIYVSPLLFILYSNLCPLRSSIVEISQRMKVIAIECTIRVHISAGLAGRTLQSDLFPYILTYEDQKMDL